MSVNRIKQAQERYAQAKRDHDAHNQREAAIGFNEVIIMLLEEIKETDLAVRTLIDQLDHVADDLRLIKSVL